MKKRLFIVSICIILMLILPFIAAGNGIFLPRPESSLSQKASTQPAESSPQEEGAPRSPENSTQEESAQQKNPAEDMVFRIKDSETGNITEIADREFCIGALAYELSPAFEEQVLCAQTVALYTHFSRIRNAARSNGQKFDLTSDTSAGQYYYSREQLKQRWGKAYKKGISLFEKAVDEVFGITLKNSGGELIDAAYFALSSGMTEDAADIFGKADANLRPVPVPWDKLSPELVSVKRFSREEYSAIISSLGGEGTEMTCKKLKRTDSGAVKSLILNGARLTGAQVRSAFGLRSADFDITAENGEIVFTARGYGHGIGMSQNGANEMAKQGAGWEEILRYFYGSASFGAGVPPVRIVSNLTK